MVLFSLLLSQTVNEGGTLWILLHDQSGTYIYRTTSYPKTGSEPTPEKSRII